MNELLKKNKYEINKDVLQYTRQFELSKIMNYLNIFL
jgi:hypothetical protein